MGEAINQWDIDEPEDLCSKYFWGFCKTYGIGHDGYEITSKDRCVDTY